MTHEAPDGQRVCCKSVSFNAIRRSDAVAVRPASLGQGFGSASIVAHRVSSAGTSVTFPRYGPRITFVRMASQVTVDSGAVKRGRSRPEKAIFRRWQRYRLNLPVQLILSQAGGTKITQGRVHDVSEGGVLLFAGVELRASDEIAIEFTPPFSGTPVRAPGAIRHRRGYTYGVEFRCQTAAEREMVAKFRNMMQLAAGHEPPSSSETGGA